MTRLSKVPVEKWDDELRALTRADTASPLELGMLRVFAHSPGVAKAIITFGVSLQQSSGLPRRLVELVRLRVAFHNRCRTCMTYRYRSAIDDGVTENLVCSLEKPSEAPDLTDREKAAIAYADLAATDHFSINDQTYDELRRHFTEPEIVELGAFIAYFVGFGRHAAAMDMTEELPARSSETSEREAPWSQESVVVLPW